MISIFTILEVLSVGYGQIHLKNIIPPSLKFIGMIFIDSIWKILNPPIEKKHTPYLKHILILYRTKISVYIVPRMISL